jgi:AraC-like DNA-binding protein
MNAQAHLQLVRELSILRDAQKNNGISRADTLRALFSILALLHEHRRNTGAPQDLPADLLTVIQFIDGNYSEDCSTMALERRFFISRSTLNRRFRMYLNTSPSHYVEARRMAAAKILLESGTSVQDTCMRCGFTDYSHFIARFRRRFGVTPLQYARQASKKNK